jgi:D-alanine-D-alanine ligase
MSIDPAKINVTVLAGGIGAERDISILSGKSVTDALKDANFNVKTADITPQNLSALDDTETDVFFLALHGQFGEDGKLQQILEDRKLIYTASGPRASAEAFDKIITKKIFTQASVKTPFAVEFTDETSVDKIREQLANVGDKFVVKPTRQGSSVGVTITDNIEETIETAKNCLTQFGNGMIEQFIDAREITAGILCGKALPLVEIKPEQSFYDYHAKYQDNATEYLLDSIDDKKLVQNIQADALKCFDALNCRHMARIDFLLDKTGEYWALEANTIPGFTDHSLLPLAAQNTGLTMGELCEKIVLAALNPGALNYKIEPDGNI